MALHETCPDCHAPGARTKDTRPTPAGRLRRRQCDACGHRWSTLEVSHDAGKALRRASLAVKAALEALAGARDLLEPLLPPEDG